MSEYQRAVPVLQVANVESSLDGMLTCWASRLIRFPKTLHTRSQYCGEMARRLCCSVRTMREGIARLRTSLIQNFFGRSI